MYKIVFFGTSELAIPSLENLKNDERFEIAGVVTQPDKPVGRSAVKTPPQVKIAAQALGISEIRQPETLKDESFRSWIETLAPSCDAFVIVAYGRILPQWLLDLPKQGIVNLHPSLLPRWRGPSPIQAAIAAGDTMTGVSIMKIDAEMDHGPLLAQVEEPIHPNDTGKGLHDRLAALGGNMLPGILADYLAGTIEPQEQEHKLATVCKILSRDDGKLDTSKTAEELERLVRAYQPWPGTWIEREGKRLKVLEARVIPNVLSDVLCLECAGGTFLELVTVHPEGKKVMSGRDFLRGVKKE